MATVYQARQDNLQRIVAIKFLDDLHAHDATHVERFRREALATGELNHRNIVTVHEFGDYEEQFYLIMEMVDGSDLQVVLNDRPGLPVEIALLLLDEIVEGLAASHSKGIIHRDIKPANVLISCAGDVKITDFGLARSVLVPAEQQNLTGEMLIGTPFYMSPEQINSLPLDSRTDVFSLGVMSYELVTGRLPFRGATMFDTLQAISTAPIPPMELGKKFSAVEQMIERAMARDPELRISSMRAFAVEIGACFEQIDPHRVLARRRRTILRRFGAERRTFLTSLADLEFEARLQRYEELEMETPLPKAGPADPGKETQKATSVGLAVANARDRTPNAAGRPRAGKIALALLGAVAVISVAIVGSVNRQPAYQPPSAIAHNMSVDSKTAGIGQDTGVGPKTTGIAHDTGVGSKTAAENRSPLIQSALSTAVPEIPEDKPAPATTRVRSDQIEKNAAMGNQEATATGTERTDLKPLSPLPSIGYVKIRCVPAGDVYLNDGLMIARTEVALLELDANRSFTITIRHPDIFGVRSWSPVVSRGDTLDLGSYRVATGTLRVAVEPPGAAAVHLEGRQTGGETPFRQVVASGKHLVQVLRPGWIVQQVTITDRTAAGEVREVLPSDPSSFQGVTVDILEGHDQKLVFHMGPKLD